DANNHTVSFSAKRVHIGGNAKGANPAHFVSAGLFMGDASVAASTSITLINKSKSATDTAAFHVIDNGKPAAIVSVPQNGSVKVPTTPMYIVNAKAPAGGSAYPHPRLMSSSVNMLAQVVAENGYYD